MKLALKLLLTACAGLTACVTSGVDEPEDELFIQGSSLADDAASLRRYDAVGSALGAGALAEASGRWEAARLAYHAVATHDPANMRAVMARTRALLASGKTAHAADLLTAVDASNEPDPQLLAATGSVLLAAGSHVRALEHLSRARQLQPSSRNTHHQLVAALILAGHHEAAVEQLAGSATADLPDHLLLPVGRSAMIAERLEAAEASFAEAARRRPADAEPWTELGRARLLRRNLPAARDALLTALGLEPNSAEAFVLLGHVRWLAGDAVRAGRCWQTALLNGAPPATIGPLVELLPAQTPSHAP
ncbi:MAG: hypothetical protein DRQ55_01970 [Planctomycetota bacterium]|nr:MAG: hypothetical protein DRQ55_01970 [Planctomycetota bacterium]